MRKIKKAMLFIIVFIIAVSIKSNTAFAEYVIQVVPTSTTNPAWTNITASDAYDECQKLNTNSSTLGTTSLKAHLTTNADWYAVSLLTLSAYGNQNASNTTGNSTGIMNFGIKTTHTSSLQEGTSSNDNWKSLYDNINTPYVENVKKSTDREQNAPGRGLLSREYITTQFGTAAIETRTDCPVVQRQSLFGVGLGCSGRFNYYCSGIIMTSVTFRPVIWNK